MSLRRPPKLAAWLLQCSGLAEQNSPLAGDLIEEFLNGRSAAWFWRQTVKAIAICAVHDVRRVDRYAIASLAGWAVQAGIAATLWSFREQPTTWSMWTLGILLLAGFLPEKTVNKSPLDQVLVAVGTCAGTLLFYFFCIRNDRLSLSGLISFEIAVLLSELMNAGKIARTRRARSK